MYIVPSQVDFTEYVDPDASVVKIRKETTSWSGTLVSEVAPTNFEITYTFDYGASGVEDKPGKHPTQRTLYIKLS
jgi:hypothetical protein